MASTLAVAATWVLAAATLAGVGFAARRILVPATRRNLARADVWVGLGVTVAYLQLWSLIAPVDVIAVFPILAGGATGIAWAARRFDRTSIPRARPVLLIAATVLVLSAANLSLGRPTSYDSGLYHFAAVEYATEHSAIPGLANLDARHGSAGPHFLFVAALGIPPWDDAGFHLANGLLVALLVFELAARLMTRSDGTFPTVLAAAVSPAVVVMIASAPGIRISSPSIDLPAFVLFVAGSLYLADAVTYRPSPTALLAMATTLALAAAVRPSLVPTTVCALAIGVWTLGKGEHRFRVVVTALTALPATIALGWAARQLVLSGLPLFPLKPALPVDWSISEQARQTYVDAVAAWAREPATPSQAVLGSWDSQAVLGSWDWVGGWISRTSRDVDVALALMLAACGMLIAVVPGAAAARRSRSAPFRAVTVTAAVGIVAWFILAPDPRFAWGPIWMLAAALVAWSLPLDRVVPATTAITIALFAATAVSNGSLARYVVADGHGPLGSFEPPTARTRPASGNRTFSVPLRGDRCWRAPLCAPHIDQHLRFRGDRVQQGLTTK